MGGGTPHRTVAGGGPMGGVTPHRIHFYAIDQGGYPPPIGTAHTVSSLPVLTYHDGHMTIALRLA